MAKNNSRIENEIEHGKYISKFGEQIWNWSSPAGQIRWNRRKQLYLSFLGNENKKVLEIGCGTGLFTKEISTSKNQITAIDISPDLLKLAQEKVPNDNVNFTIENAYNSSFEDNSFDFIIGSSVLHHLEVDKALKEFYRILKPGGKVLFTDPNMMNPQIAVQKNVPFIKKMAGDSPDETAFFRWSIGKKLKKHGYTNVKVTPFDFLHPAIPRVLLKPLVPFTNMLEKIPFFKEISGSLIIYAEKN